MENLEQKDTKSEALGEIGSLLYVYGIKVLK